jgi:hypothetical protein
MSLGNLIVDIYQNIIDINGNKILVLTDNDNKNMVLTSSNIKCSRI